MDFINLLGSVWPEGNLWASIIKLFDVGSYAWTIILFTLVLKLVLSPIDFSQRYFTNKQMRAQAKLQPELEKLKKRYGQNQTLLYQKQNELYKKNNVRMSGSCIVMLVYMAVTLTVFLTLFSSLQSISGFKIKNQYEDLQQVYYNSYQAEYMSYLDENFNLDDFNALTFEDKSELIEEYEEIKLQEIINDLTDVEEDEKEAVAQETINLVKTTYQQKAQKEVKNRYVEIKDHWLWVKSIWRPDKATVKEIPSYSEFKASAGDGVTTETEYNLVMGELLKEGTNQTNGYYILSVIVVLVSLLSQIVIRRVSRPKSKTGEPVNTAQPGVAKMMMFIMPITMLIFTLSSSAIFSIYIITNSLTTTLITPAITLICNKIEDNQEKKHKEELKNKVDYRR